MRLVLLSFLVLLASCGEDSKVEPREQYWTDELSSFFKEERTLTELHTWLREHDVYYVFDSNDVEGGEWHVELERINLNEIVCESWFFFLEVSFGESEQIDSYSLEQMGVCL